MLSWQKSWCFLSKADDETISWLLLQAIQDNIDRVMQKKQKIQDLTIALQEERRKLAELRSRQVREEICGTNFFIR
eukprot:scaffold362810_cov26-Prasinocladus_malaysianus.AAC.1